MCGKASVAANCMIHWQQALYAPVSDRTRPGKISDDTIHGNPFPPNDQLKSDLIADRNHPTHKRE